MFIAVNFWAYCVYFLLHFFSFLVCEPSWFNYGVLVILLFFFFFVTVLVYFFKCPWKKKNTKQDVQNNDGKKLELEKKIDEEIYETSVVLETSPSVSETLGMEDTLSLKCY